MITVLDIKENGPYFIIGLREIVSGMEIVCYQRKYVIQATQSDLTFQETVIIALCNKVKEVKP